jgi:hypothetical protein
MTVGDDARANAIAKARREALRDWGDWLPRGDGAYVPVVSGTLRGLPPWPKREAFRAICGPTSTLVVTDGLSDPFAPGDEVEGLEHVSGYGIELWAETDEVSSEKDVTHTRAFGLVSVVAYHVADLTPSRLQLDCHGIVSMEIHAQDVGTLPWPAGIVSDDGRIGILLGLRAPARPTTIALPPSDVRYACVRVITRAELLEIREHGAAARDRLRDALERTPGGWISRVAVR